MHADSRNRRHLEQSFGFQTKQVNQNLLSRIDWLAT
jgi:hypothetical protein